jgi:hypothetical protein
MGIETTKEKQSDLVQGLGSRLPRTTVLLLARVGISLVHLIVKVHMGGIALIPCNLHNLKYSSFIISNVLLEVRPSYSSLYDVSQVVLSG